MAMNNYDDGLAAVGSTVVANPADYETFVAVFARTYSHSEDPAAVVDLYHDYQQARAKHPNAGSSKLASKLGVPRSNIRKWVDDGAVPYVVQGLQTAETRGWIPMAFDSVEFRAMNRLIAWVMSSGSIHGDRWGVQFVVDDAADRDRLEQTLSTLDLATVEPDAPGTELRGTAVTASPDGSVLGRVLHSLGAPRGGEKHTDDVRLPPYLDHAPNRRRREWLRTYLRNRQRERNADNQWISFGEDRPAEYQHEFVELVADVTGASASVSGTGVYVGADAATVLDHCDQRYRQLDAGGDPLPLADVESIVATYADPEAKLELLDQYRRFQAAEGFWTNIAREEGIPTSRAGNWKDGSTPSIVTVVDAATDREWLADEWTATVESLADLVIGIHAGGSIGSSFTPQWYLDGARQERIRAALDTVGINAREQNGGLIPAENAAALGRMLVAAGAPRGTDQNRGQLPDWVFLASAARRERWLRTIVAQRGSQFKDRSPTRNISLDRPQSFLADVALLIEAVTGVDVHLHDGRVTVAADAVRELGLV